MKKFLFLFILAATAYGQCPNISLVAHDYSSIDAMIYLAPGQGALMPSVATYGNYRINWWQSTYPNYFNDPGFESVSAVSIVGDFLYVSRGQYGTIATKKGAGNTYFMKTVGNICPPAPTSTPTGIAISNFPPFPTLPPTPQLPVSVVDWPTAIPQFTFPPFWPSPTWTYTITATPTPTFTGSATPTPGGVTVANWPTQPPTPQLPVSVVNNPTALPTQSINVANWPTAVPYPTQPPWPTQVPTLSVNVANWATQVPTPQIQAYLMNGVTILVGPAVLFTVTPQVQSYLMNPPTPDTTKLASAPVQATMSAIGLNTYNLLNNNMDPELDNITAAGQASTVLLNTINGKTVTNDTGHIAYAATPQVQVYPMAPVTIGAATLTGPLPGYTVTPGVQVYGGGPVTAGAATITGSLPGFANTPGVQVYGGGPVTIGAATITGSMPGFASTPIITGGVTLNSPATVYGGGPLTVGAATISGPLPTGSNTLGSVTVLGGGPVTVAAHNVTVYGGGPLTLGAGTALFGMAEPYYVSATATGVHATGLAVSCVGSYPFNKLTMAITQTAGSSATTLSVWDITYGSYSAGTSLCAITITGASAQAQTYFNNTPGLTYAVSIVGIAAATTESVFIGGEY